MSRSARRFLSLSASFLLAAGLIGALAQTAPRRPRPAATRWSSSTAPRTPRAARH